MTTPSWIRTIYLYLITAITIVMTIIALVNVVKIGLEYAFNVKDYEEINIDYQCQDGWAITNTLSRTVPKRIESDLEPPYTEEEKAKCIEKTQERAKLNAANNRKRNIIWSIAMLIVALPLYLYHWSVIKKDHKK
jgi:hypothetical protein